MILMRISITLILLFQLSTVFSSVTPAVKEPKSENPKSILMIGNSFMYYNNGVHNPLVRLIRATQELGKGHKIRLITINGSSLSWHDVNSYVKNPNIGSFSITVTIFRVSVTQSGHSPVLGSIQHPATA